MNNNSSFNNIEIIDLTLDDDEIPNNSVIKQKQTSKPKTKAKAKTRRFSLQIPTPSLRRFVDTNDLKLTIPKSFSHPFGYVPDFKLKPLHQLYRPYFSPQFDSYEMDYVNTGRFFDEKNQVHIQNYLFVININTKYLFSVPLPAGEAPSVERTTQALEVVFQKLYPKSIDNLRADADTAFGRTDLNIDISITNKKLSQNQRTLFNYLNFKGVKRVFFSSSKFTNKNRCVDRAIRTIRDLVGQKVIRLLNPDIVEHLVDLYNQTPHSAFLHKFSPSEVQNNPEIEGVYIRHQKRVLQEVQDKESEVGINLYKPGNIIMIYIPKDKTSHQFDKRRRNFSDLAVFINYKNGNVVCELLDQLLFKNPIIEIPIYYTKFVSDNVYTLPQIYKDVFVIRPSPNPFLEKRKKPNFI
jgi:hypothetical protein